MILLQRSQVIIAFYVRPPFDFCIPYYDSINLKKCAIGSLPIKHSLTSIYSYMMVNTLPKEAVKAGLTLPANNGVVEGKVNKLKLTNKMGYGRAGFAWLATAGATRFVGASPKPA